MRIKMMLDKFSFFLVAFFTTIVASLDLEALVILYDQEDYYGSHEILFYNNTDDCANLQWISGDVEAYQMVGSYNCIIMSFWSKEDCNENSYLGSVNITTNTTKNTTLPIIGTNNISSVSIEGKYCL